MNRRGIGSVTSSGAADVAIPTDEFLWIDLADTGAFTESAGTITGVTNKASSEVWDTGTLPTYEATGFNSAFPCMHFDGSTQSISSTEAAVISALSDAKSYSLYYVASCDTADLSMCIFGVGSSAEATNRSKRWGTFTTGTGVWIYTQNNNAGANTNTESSAANNTSPHVFGWTSGATTLALRVDSTVQTMSNAGAHGTGALTPTQAALGALPRQALAAFFDGKIAELKAYPNEHSADVRNAIMSSLATKWGL